MRPTSSLLGRCVHCSKRPRTERSRTSIPVTTNPVHPSTLRFRWSSSSPSTSSTTIQNPISPRRYTTTPALPLTPSIPPPTGNTASPSPSIEPLPRSIGPSTALFLLTLPIPPSAWPSKLEFASPLLSLTSRTLRSRGIVVNAIWDGSSSATFDNQSEEVYPARLFWPDGTIHTYPSFSASTLISPDFQGVISKQISSVDKQSALSVSGRKEEGPVEIAVCTHGSRDCRCGDTGGALVIALKEEISRKGLEEKVKVGEVAHVGGHKYAANAILLPSLDLLGNLLPSHAPHLISWLLEGRQGTDDMWQYWRGRYGLTELEQAGVWGGTGWAHREEKEGEEASKIGASGNTGSEGKEGEVEKEVEEVEMRFKTYEGEMRVVKAKIGESLLELGKREGLPSIEGVCGGKLECATCHIYLPSSAPVHSPSDAEEDMLGYALGYREGQSRLGCQIRVTEELAGWAEGEGGVIGLPRY